MAASFGDIQVLTMTPQQQDSCQRMVRKAFDCDIESWTQDVRWVQAYMENHGLDAIQVLTLYPHENLSREFSLIGFLSMAGNEGQMPPTTNQLALKMAAVRRYLEENDDAMV